MKTAHFRFYDELNDFFKGKINPRLRKYSFNGRQTIKDCVESMGVPHPEIAFILKNGKTADFSALVKSGDRISLFPAFSELPLPPQNRLRPPSQPPFCFVLDIHLGKLARYLRMLGFDTLYRNDYSDPQLAAISEQENRILLTRDLGLLKRSRIVYGYYIREDDPQCQLLSVLNRFNLFDKFEKLGRCFECNTPLEPVEKSTIRHRLEPKTKLYFEEFYRCPYCNKIYWKGSHYNKMMAFIEKLKENQYQLAFREI